MISSQCRDGGQENSPAIGTSLSKRDGRRQWLGGSSSDHVKMVVFGGFIVSLMFCRGFVNTLLVRVEAARPSFSKDPGYPGSVGEICPKG